MEQYRGLGMKLGMTRCSRSPCRQRRLTASSLVSNASIEARDQMNVRVSPRFFLGIAALNATRRRAALSIARVRSAVPQGGQFAATQGLPLPIPHSRAAAQRTLSHRWMMAGEAYRISERDRPVSMVGRIAGMLSFVLCLRFLFCHIPSDSIGEERQSRLSRNRL